MSNKTYVDLLNETSELIGEATQADEAVTESGVQDRAALQPLLLELRVRYTVLIKVCGFSHNNAVNCLKSINSSINQNTILVDTKWRYKNLLVSRRYKA